MGNGAGKARVPSSLGSLNTTNPEDDESNPTPTAASFRLRRGADPAQAPPVGSAVLVKDQRLEATHALSEVERAHVLAVVKRDNSIEQLTLFDCGLDDAFIGMLTALLLVRCGVIEPSDCSQAPESRVVLMDPPDGTASEGSAHGLSSISSLSTTVASEGETGYETATATATVTDPMKLWGSDAPEHVLSINTPGRPLSLRSTVLVTPLVTLNLSGNPLSDAAVLPLVLSLPELGTQRLNLSRTQVSDRTLVSLAGVLGRSALRRVWLSGCNHVTDHGVIVMCEAIAQSSRVEFVCTGCPGVSEHLAHRIADANDTARQLHLLRTRAQDNREAVALCDKGLEWVARGDAAGAKRLFRRAEALHPQLWQAAHGFKLVAQTEGNAAAVKNNELKIMALGHLPDSAWEGEWVADYRRVAVAAALTLAAVWAAHRAARRRQARAKKGGAVHKGAAPFSTRHRRTQRRRASSKKSSDRPRAELEALRRETPRDLLNRPPLHDRSAAHGSFRRAASAMHLSTLPRSQPTTAGTTLGTVPSS